MSDCILRDIMEKAKKIFFIGIGGISMHALAEVCRGRGYIVCGSDRVKSELTEKLVKDGITVYEGHKAENTEGCDLVIYSGAVGDDNPELSAAREKGIPCFCRADLLGYIMLSYKNRIGVSGMHGKSTATAMLAHLFTEAGRDPSVMCGAVLPEIGGAYRSGKGDDFIFEACEYKDSFLHMFPTVSVILNIELDHTDYFSGMDMIKSSFSRFARIPEGSGADITAAVYCKDNENASDTVNGLPYGVSYGIDNKECDYTAEKINGKNGRFEFTVCRAGEECARIKLSVPGRHNIYNALACFAVSCLYGIPEKKAADAISGFSGIKRRFEYKGTCGGADVYIDYAHHPTEIDASVKAAREMTGGKVIVIFEPHTYSRTAALFDGFVRSLSNADTAIICDIYAAREINTFGISSQDIADKISGACYAPTYDTAAGAARTLAGEGDIILILGAGTVDSVADLLCE